MKTYLLEEITTETLEELDKKVKMQFLTYDIMLKNTFERNEWALKRFLISVLHLEINPSDCKITYLDKELPLTNYKERHKIVDFNITINDCIFVNLELNRGSYNNVKHRNHLFHNKLVSYTLKSGQAIKNIPQYTNIQLNLNAYEKNNNFGEDIIVPYSLKTDSIHIENDIVYLRYLDYYNKLYYNKNIQKEESDYWLATLTSKNFTELNSILNHILKKDLREKIIKDVLNLSMDKLVLEECEREALEAIQERDTRENGRKEGIEQGKEQQSINMIKSMLQNDLEMNMISKISGKTIEEIKKIEESIKEK